MPSTVEQLSPSRVKITIEVPFSELKPSIDKAYREVAKQINIPGFRKGKVPPMVIDQRVGRGTVLQEAINEALPQFYGAAVEEHKLVPLAQPEVEVTNLVDKEKVEFTAEVDVRPEFDLPDFSTISAEVETVEVTDADVEEQLQALRERFATSTVVERAAAEGDVVTISLVARKDGEELADATAEDLQYTIGAGGMLDGLDEAATGLSAGETTTFTTTLVGGAHKGEEVEVELTVSQVSERELPEVDDDFAQLASPYDTIGEVTDQIREELTRRHRLEQAQNARDAVLATAIEDLEIDVPEGIRTSELAARKEQINNQLAQMGVTLEEYLAESEEAEDEDAFWADVEKRSSDALTSQLVLDKYADENEIGVDQNELLQHVMQIAQQSGVDPQQELQHMVEHNHMPEYMAEIRRRKALAAIVEAATITDAAGDPVDLSNLQADGSIADPDAEVPEVADEAAVEEPTAAEADDAATDEADQDDADKA
ncbi:MAG TPA: trigger factor [Candidatus Avipropionibacterium avicola]|uniref:Trigger factor n=1 Tax=Candidatus Avipropionibacterium avicola TaxID=2840701 RepID=A0A9D1GZE6_9ACTN|nr:trigger factor [Candidatus Avipropionibacterium avicola]